jgi:hypothetical protein
MKSWFLNRYTRQVVQYTLLFLLGLYLLSGFGITEFRIVEAATFGIFTKNVAFVIHNNILIPMLILLVVHILQGYLSGKYRRSKTT